jgi:hypothetical protein
MGQSNSPNSQSRDLPHHYHQSNSHLGSMNNEQQAIFLQGNQSMESGFNSLPSFSRVPSQSSSQTPPQFQSRNQSSHHLQFPHLGYHNGAHNVRQPDLPPSSQSQHQNQAMYIQQAIVQQKQRQSGFEMSPDDPQPVMTFFLFFFF